MRKLVLAAVLVLMASGAQAVTLNVIGGQLHGAFGVDVGGVLYDVEFVDGTCIDLFDGCNSPADFPAVSTTLASQALLDQVFVDGPSGAFDSDPSLTHGCINLYECYAITPRYVPTTTYIAATRAINCAFINDSNSCGDRTLGEGPDRHPGLNTSGGYDLGRQVYARWAPAEPIPEPSTALLLGLGLVGLAARRRV